jgi:hypothetical protein
MAKVFEPLLTTPAGLAFASDSKPLCRIRVEQMPAFSVTTKAKWRTLRVHELVRSRDA